MPRLDDIPAEVFRVTALVATRKSGSVWLLLLLLLASGIFACPVGVAATETWSASVRSASDDDLLAMRDRFLAEDEQGLTRGWQLGFSLSNPEGGYIAWGMAPVMTNGAGRTKGEARLAAVRAAQAEALADFALARYRQVAVTTLQRHFDLTLAPDASWQAALAGLEPSQRVDGLRQLGEIHGLERGRSMVNLRESTRLVSREIVRQTTVSLAGVRWLATFELPDQVGVLLIHQPRLERLAGQLVLDQPGRGAAADREAVAEAVTALPAEQLLRQHGVRVLADSQQRPMVLAFGQAAPALSAAMTPRERRAAVSEARRVAAARADRAVVETFNTVLWARETFRDGQVEWSLAESAPGEPDGMRWLSSVTQMIRQQSRMNLAGLETLREWHALDAESDDEALTVGVIRLWRPHVND